MLIETFYANEKLYKTAILQHRTDKLFFQLLSTDPIYNRQLFKNIYNLDIICGDELIINMIPLGNTFFSIVYFCDFEYRYNQDSECGYNQDNDFNTNKEKHHRIYGYKDCDNKIHYIYKRYAVNDDNFRLLLGVL